ncbi:hypothetical protein R50073_25610 [Maricurvus nonylphenolicus]|uniref:cation/multidrug efflux pump n=1 Tax=Maricurvus nonylphenolicus TaxID=1008307 RepID=UPI0036F4287C
MLFDGLALFIALLCCLLLWAAGALLWKRGWLLGWLRGMAGTALILFGAVMAFAAVDVFSYKQLQSEQTIATLSFDALGTQHYRVLLVDASGRESRYELRGDQWQLDARFLKWKGSLARWGLKPGYRMDRLGGRYYSLEKERNAERTVYDLNGSQSTVDVWQWIKSAEGWPGIDAAYGSATFVPMADGALYEVRVSTTGLLARPLNDRAQSAVNRWQ